MRKKYGKNKKRCKCLSCQDVFYQYVYKNGGCSGKFCSPSCYYKSLKGRKLNNRWRAKIRETNIKTKALVVISPKDRFWAKVSKTDTCWNWLGALHAGYGVFYLGSHKNQVRASRYSYEINVGPIPKDLTIDHLCRNKKCVNPEHLEAVTMRVNVLRNTGPSAINAIKTHCIRGHEFTDNNTYRSKGHRSCKACRANVSRVKSNP